MALIFFTLPDHFFHTLHQTPSIRETCQIIVIRQIVNPCFRLLIFMIRFIDRQPVDPGQHQIIRYSAAEHSKEIVHLPDT
ncbi:hypothetical protein D3C75_769020 [compost metagenome]